MKPGWLPGLLTSTRRTELFEISARNGKLIRFTKFQRDLTALGVLWRAIPGFERSQVGGGADFRATDSQVRSIFDALGMTQAEIETGVFDGAKVRLRAVDWSDTSLVGPAFEGQLGEFSFGSSGFFDAQLLSVLQQLEIQQGKFTQPMCDVELFSYKCTVPDPFDICRSTPYVQARGAKTYGKVLTGLARTVVPLLLTNAGFEGATLAPWITVSGNPTQATAGGLFAFEGAKYLSGSGSSPDGFEIRRIDDIITAAILGAGLDPDDPDDDAAIEALTESITDAIDGGEATLEASIQRGNNGSDTRDSGAVRIEALDEDGGSLAVLWDYEAQSGMRLRLRSYDIPSPPNAWQIRTAAGRRVPATTRQLAIYLEGVTRNGSVCNSAFDDLQVNLILHGARVSQAGYENKIFELVTEGTTDDVAPTYDPTPGNTTVDGTTEWICREAWVRHAVVATVVSSTILALTVDEVRSETDDEWFEGGTVRAETGANAGLQGQIIKTWVGSTKRLTLFFGFPFAFEAGDELVIAKGCLKRPIDCKKFFYEDADPQPGNIANFQGQPTLPGTDAISKTPMIVSGF